MRGHGKKVVPCPEGFFSQIEKSMGIQFRFTSVCGVCVCVCVSKIRDGFCNGFPYVYLTQRLIAHSLC